MNGTVREVDNHCQPDATAARVWRKKLDDILTHHSFT